MTRRGIAGMPKGHKGWLPFKMPQRSHRGRPDPPEGWPRKAPSALSDLLDVESLHAAQVFRAYDAFSGSIFCCLATGAIPGQAPGAGKL